MASNLPFSITALAIFCLLFDAATTVHGAAAEPRRNAAARNGGGVKLPVIHVYGDSSPYTPPNTTWERLISQTFSTNAALDVPIAPGRVIKEGNYIIKVDFGTPGESFYTVIDTGSDITWIPCVPCSDCDLQSNTPFNPSTSSSYRPLTCRSAQCKQVDSLTCNDMPPDPNASCLFSQVYGDQSGFNASLSTETLSLGSDCVPGFVFGCVHIEIGTSMAGLGPGLVGLGRRPLSLVSQTAELYHKTFGYCLPSQQSSKFSGWLMVGKQALSARGLKFTPLLTNPADPSSYYVGLKGISVGGEVLSGIPPETFVLNTTDGGGTIIDSGTVITRLPQPAYDALKRAFRKRISLHPLQNTSDYDPFDTCYEISSSRNGMIYPPGITLHFEGGVDLELREEHIIAYGTESVVCLAFAASSGDSNTLSILGNYQQQNMRVVYDLPNSRLGFAAENCSA